MIIEAHKFGDGNLLVTFNDRVSVPASAKEMKGAKWYEAYVERCKAACEGYDYGDPFTLSDDDLEALADAVKAAK